MRHVYALINRITILPIKTNLDTQEKTDIDTLRYANLREGAVRSYLDGNRGQTGCPW